MRGGGRRCSAAAMRCPSENCGQVQVDRKLEGGDMIVKLRSSSAAINKLDPDDQTLRHLPGAVATEPDG